MPTRRQVGRVLVCGAILALAPSPLIRTSASRTLRVGSSRRDAAELQRTLDSAGDGDTVVVTGDYLVASPIIVRRKRLSLLGVAARITSNLPHDSDWFQFIDCNVTFDGDWTFDGIETLAAFVASAPKAHKDISGFVCFEGGRPGIGPGFKSSGKRCAVKLMRCTNGLVEGLVHRGFMRDDDAPGPTGSNFAPAIYVERGTGNTVRDCHAYDSGSLATAAFDTQALTVEGGSGENFKDNGVYISSGTGCTVRGVEVARIAGFGSGIKVRGSRNQVLDCTVTDTGNGVSMTGNGPKDASGANGYGNLCRGNRVRSYRHHAFNFGVQDRFYQRDLTFSDCSAVGSRKAAGYAAFVVMVTSGLQMQGITVDGYDGTSFAGVISGAVKGRPATNIRVDGVRFRNAAAVPEALRLQFVDAASIRNIAGENIGPHLIDGRDVTRSEFVGLRHPAGSYLTLAKRYRNADNRFSGGGGVPVVQ